MANLVLVGTVHSDFKGPERLMKILGFYKNPAIAVESTKDEAEDAKQKWTVHRKAIEDKLKRFPTSYTPKQVSDLRAYVESYCFESNIPYHFQSQNSNALVFPVGIEVVNLDKWMDFKVQQYIQSGKDPSKLIGHNDPSIEDLLKNGIEIHQKAIDRTYEEDDSSFMQELMGEIFPFMTTKRDEHFAKRIRELREEYPARDLVGVFGNMHVFGNYTNNLYNQLRDLNPIRIRLNEADKF